MVVVFRELGVSNRLLTLVEGESLLNDGVAIVLSQILVLAALGGSLSVIDGLGRFVQVFFGGIAIGVAIGTIAVLLLPLLGRLPAAALSIAVAYGGYVLADAVLGFSGVMATVASGVIVGSMTESRARMDVRDMLHEFWDALGFMANALLFLFIGLALDFDLIGDNLQAIGVGIIAVLLARPVAVMPVIWLLEKLHLMVRVGRRNSAVVVWGGLRGGVALALALALPAAVPHRETIVAMTGGIVLATLLVNATTIGFHVHALGLDKTSRTDQFLSAAARIFAIEATRRRLEDLNFEDGVVDAHLTAAEVTARDDLVRSHLTPAEELQVLTLRGLHIERETYQSLSDAGLLPPIATRTLMSEIDDEIEEASHGELQVDAARREHLPWYARAHRRALGSLPPPLGEDLLEVGYIEVSARRLAAQKAAAGLEQFSSLPNIDREKVRLAQRTFTDWEESATRVLEQLDQQADVDQALLHRRQAQALSRITVREVLFELVSSGVLEESAAEDAAARIGDEVGGPR